MDELTAIRRPVAAELTSYQALFEEALTHEDDFLGTVLAHIRQRKGKMMRPLLVVLVARERGTVGLSALRSAVSLELLHTASLVHDDVVDESSQRRGQASVNATYDNKVSVLVGDYLLSCSLRQAALTGDVRSVDVIARLGGTLSEGEVFQLANIRNEEATEEAYFHIIGRKTASLFAACAELGAMASGADEAFVAVARDFGWHVGMCFQIRDDIFDYYDNGNIGKPAGNDMREGKLTLPAIYALGHTDNSEMKAVAQRIKKGEATAEEISDMAAFAKSSGGVEYARKVMGQYQAKAAACLTAFRNNEVREALEKYLAYVIGRDF